MTIGYDTSLNTIMNCVDILRDTATSHERVFLVEVMGRDAGFLTLNAAIAAGAEAAIIPERATVMDQIEAAILQGRRKDKNSSIVLVQEHAIEGGAQAVAKMVEAAHPEYSARVTILGPFRGVVRLLPTTVYWLRVWVLRQSKHYWKSNAASWSVSRMMKSCMCR